MASKTLTPSLLRNVARRSYGAQAAAAVHQTSYTLPAQEAQVTALPNGIVVASLENNAPVSRLALLFKAGSRYESAGNLGASHLLRSYAGLSTKNMTTFAITRTVQQVGGSLSAVSAREHVLYGIDLIRDNVDTGLEVLANVGLQPSFKPWELKDSKPRLMNEIAMQDPSATAIELLHNAAFRTTGLGNFLYVAPHQVGNLTPQVLSDYVASTHLASRAAVVGLGVDHDALVSYAGSLPLGTGSGPAGATTYSGGDVRQENGSSVTIVAVAGKGASIGSNDAAALAVAQQILGVGPSTKYGTNPSSALANAVASTGGLGAASALNVNYSDTGLFGYFVIADSASVDKILPAVHNTVKSLKVSEEDVTRGKNKVKAAMHLSTEAGAELVEEMGLQALFTGKFVNTAAATAAVDAVTPAAVEAAVSKVLGGKLSMGAVGSLTSVPYSDQL